MEAWENMENNAKPGTAIRWAITVEDEGSITLQLQTLPEPAALLCGKPSLHSHNTKRKTSESGSATR
jgi:hypothetical protein